MVMDTVRGNEWSRSLPIDISSNKGRQFTLHSSHDSFFICSSLPAPLHSKTGSHCAGTIGAIGNNDVGVTSVNPDPNKIDFFIGKGLSDSGSGSTSGVLAAAMACKDNGADIISMSLGGGGWGQSSVDTYTEIYDAGVLIIAAAGNGVSH